MHGVSPLSVQRHQGVACVTARDFRWGHGGSADGICTDVRTYPRTGETVIVLSNRDAPACYGVSAFLHAHWPGRDPAGMAP